MNTGELKEVKIDIRDSQATLKRNMAGQISAGQGELHLLSHYKYQGSRGGRGAA